MSSDDDEVVVIYNFLKRRRQYRLCPYNKDSHIEKNNKNNMSFQICRCCLGVGDLKDMNTQYKYGENKEIYSEMLQECFDIVLSQRASNSICNNCISRLRDARDFRQQVIHSEEMIYKILQRENGYRDIEIKSDLDVNDAEYLDDTNDNKSEVSVKLEPKSEDSNDSDNMFLSHIVKEECPEENENTGQKKQSNSTNLVKKRQTEKSPKKKEKALKKNGHNSNKDLVLNRISNEIQIKNILSRKVANSTDRYKHRENLKTLLKYSNAMPFKDKSLLGFICGYCDKTFQDFTQLRTHTNTDHIHQRLTPSMKNLIKLEITDLKCTICDKSIDSLTNLKSHLVKDHKKIFYDVKDHIMPFKVTKTENFNCVMCTSAYETFKMLKQHMNRHYANYICEECNSSFITKRSLTNHKTTHIEGSFKCDLCDKVFSNHSKKIYHQKMSHMGLRQISNCPICNESFRSYYQKNQHMVKIHNSEAQYKCNICDKGYVLKTILTEHIKKCHLMERNFPCTECGYKSFTRKSLSTHMLKHTGERKYACEVCHKKYQRKYTLREHMRIHNNDRRFKCDVCGNAFVQKCSLKSHLLSHHGISMTASEITVTEKYVWFYFYLKYYRTK